MLGAFEALAATGAIAGCASVWLPAEFVRILDPAHLGRVASISTLGYLALVPLATPAFGALSAAVGIGVSPLVLACGMIALCGVIATRPGICGLAPR